MKHSRRNFLHSTVAGASALGLGNSIFCPEKIMAEETGEVSGIQTYLSQCPYCGVGCGSVIKADASGRILGVVPDKQHPTNKGANRRTGKDGGVHDTDGQTCLLAGCRRDHEGEICRHRTCEEPLDKSDRQKRLGVSGQAQGQHGSRSAECGA